MAKLKHIRDGAKSAYASATALSYCGRIIRVDPFSLKPKCLKCERVYKILWDKLWAKQFANPKQII